MILKQHQDFAKELVELARKHNMTNINMTFRLNFSANVNAELLEGYVRPYDSDTRLQWSEGRHGAKSNIRLDTGIAVTIPESKDGA